MFVNKIGNGLKNQQVFKGYQHEIDEIGNEVKRFNYPYDYSKEKYGVEFYNVKENPAKYSGYEIIGNKPIGYTELKQGGTEIDINSIEGLDADKVFAYRIVRSNGERIADTGINVDGFNIVSTSGTTPMVQGPGALAMVDLHRPGAYYNQKTGKVHYNKEQQVESEKLVRNFANSMGGTLAGFEYDLDALQNGTSPQILKDVKVLFGTPIGGGDNRSAFGYWNGNNMQISRQFGTSENYESFLKKLFMNGKKFVYDGTFTSEGLEGIHFQYALRWAQKNPQTYYWFKMTGLKNDSIGLGVIPKHDENLRHRMINPPTLYDEEHKRIISNPEYNSDKETYIQLYDALQVTEEQLSHRDKPLGPYTKLNSENPLAINTHDDTVISYLFEVDPSEYTERLNTLLDYNSQLDTPIKLNSPEGTKLIGQFSSFKFIPKTEGGSVTWDANTDMQKMNYHISPYDEMILKSIVDDSQRDYETEMTVRGTYEVQDLALQAARFWAGKTRRIQNIYTAQTLQSASTKEAIDKLILEKKLPEEARLTEEAIKNILNNEYELEAKGIMEKDDITVKALMTLPLDSLELGDNTVGVLSTSYLSNRAASPETIGLTRFELMQQDEPHLVEEYAENYMKMNSIYKNELKNFADRVIQKVNETSNEKLLDDDGSYTEYGEYVIDLIGQDIAKYGFLKSLSGDKLTPAKDAWMWEDGTITYDYDKIRENTTIKALGIRAHNPADEAAEIRKLIKKGLGRLDASDVDFVANSISEKIAGTNVNSFRLAEAIVNKASLGLDMRLDAAKDIIDWDAVRNKTMSFDDAWDQTIEFWTRFVETIKKENPHAYIVAEITDIESLMQSTFGEEVNPHDRYLEIGNKYKSFQDAMVQFYLKTGIVSEAAYSYTFTNLLKVFSPEFEKGTDTGSMKDFMDNFYNLLTTRGIDYIRNLWTFADNHDKPSVIHGMALNMKLFHANLESDAAARETTLRMLANIDENGKLPLELEYFGFNNMDYFRTASPQAAAMSQLMRGCLNAVNGITSEQTHYLQKAISNLTNGYHLGQGVEFKLALDDVKELSTLKGALESMLSNANINLTQDEINNIVNYADSKIGSYFANKDINSEESKQRIKTILSNDANPDNCNENNLEIYSLYAVAIAGALREALYAVKPDIEIDKQHAFWASQKSFIKKYNKSFIENKLNSLPFIEDSAISNKKIGYAANDFETVIRMIIKEAEYLEQKDGKLEQGRHFENSDSILEQLFKISTQPAIKKAVMYASFLSALPGIPTTFIRDMLGSLGYDEKAKNVWLKNRNAIPWSQLEEGPLKGYRTQILKEFMEAINLRTLAGEALNNGVPYKASTDEGIQAIFMQDGHGNASVSLFNTNGINHANYAMPQLEEVHINQIWLDTGLALPEKLEFKNANLKDTATYIVKKLGDRFAIVNKNNGTIALNNLTAKNGAMILKHVAFKANNRTFNKQYNIVSNPYKQIETPESGQALSIIAK